MDEDIGEIQPQELRFLFEPKKKISCFVKLINKSDHHVAFKVKTTHVKLYCVKPNEGIINPGSTCELKVTRQAQRVAPLPDEIAKEKFMFQRTFVPEGTVIGDIASLFRSDDGSNNINTKKLKVVVDVVPMAEEMKSKIKELDLRLREVEKTISKLKEQKSDHDQKGKKMRPRVFIKCFNVNLA